MIFMKKLVERVRAKFDENHDYKVVYDSEVLNGDINGPY